jgi:hypothetical protein
MISLGLLLLTVGLALLFFEDSKINKYDRTFMVRQVSGWCGMILLILGFILAICNESIIKPEMNAAKKQIALHMTNMQNANQESASMQVELKELEQLLIDRNKTCEILQSFVAFPFNTNKN